ncbi:MerR family transcriptional regulator [Nocardioides convexus]|uniref:MerR family transcriptional regulator n=1 Tax=Nocardioides convexus TaxID=2712224 RepID=UPI0024186B67|nr:MerR family transcriptional regulator [Nocardioides convexus]
MTAATHPIGEVVEQTGLSHHTLRFYERERLLLGEIARDGAGRRRYSAADLEWIGLCTKAYASRGCRWRRSVSSPA